MRTTRIQACRPQQDRAGSAARSGAGRAKISVGRHDARLTNRQVASNMQRVRRRELLGRGLATQPFARRRAGWRCGRIPGPGPAQRGVALAFAEGQLARNVNSAMVQRALEAGPPTVRGQRPNAAAQESGVGSKALHTPRVSTQNGRDPDGQRLEWLPHRARCPA